MQESVGGVSPHSRTGRQIRFPPYRLDIDAGLLRAGERTISLRPKTWAVLCYLAEHPGVLVTKEELLDAVWGGIAVTEATLTKSIGEIRDVLHDEVRHPRFVETVHRRGFRFVPAVDGAPAPTPEAHPPLAAPAGVVGREAELRRLEELFETAARGTRQVAFVTGEAGIGKTTLVEAFLAGVAARSPGVIVASGQCVRRHSGEEPLMPVLEALARLARGPHAARVGRLLRERAPGWLVQLPWLVDPEELRELRTTVAGTTPERMLRVFAQLVEELTADVTLVLVLEDLHWADPATVDLVSILAERPDGARLLLLGTYRPAEAIARSGPFDAMRRALAVKRRAVQLLLDGLPLAGVEAYLATRFGGHQAPPWLARLLHAQTEGNPLFLVTAVDHLVARGRLEATDQGPVAHAAPDALERDVPGSLQELVETQVVGLDPFEVAVLEAAAVAGLEFGAQAVAAALDAAVEQVEETCERLVRSQRFLRARDTEAWPDGAVAARYAFTHALYQRVLYHRLPARRRQVLHQKIGERLEAGFGARAAEAAVELAAHFEQSPEPMRAIIWLESAAGSAHARFAPREAAGFLRRALALLASEPDGPQRWRRELPLASSLGAAAIALQGFAAEEALASLTRARHVAAQVGSPLALFQVLYMLLAASHSRADASQTFELAEELAGVAARVDTPEARLVASMMVANGAFWEGRYAEATGLAKVAGADRDVLGRLVPGANLVVWSNGAEGWRLWLLGHPDRALTSARAAVSHARALPDPLQRCMASFFVTQIHVWRGDLDEADRLVEEGRAVAGEYGFGLWHAALGGIGGGSQLARGDAAGAIGDLQQAVAELRRIGAWVYLPALLTGVGEASLRLGRVAEGLAAVDEGLEMARTSLSRWQGPELWRVRGELLAARGDPADVVESCFAQALELARPADARAFALRAATALARRLAGRRLKADARATLAPRYAAFTEGLDTVDLRTARALLAELGS